MIGVQRTNWQTARGRSHIGDHGDRPLTVRETTGNVKSAPTDDNGRSNNSHRYPRERDDWDRPCAMTVTAHPQSPPKQTRPRPPRPPPPPRPAQPKHDTHRVSQRNAVMQYTVARTTKRLTLIVNNTENCISQD